MGPFLLRVGRSAARHPWRVLLVWLAVAVGVLGAKGALGGEPTNSFDVPGAESQDAVDLIEDRFPGLTGTISRVVFHAAEGTLEQPATQAGIEASVRRIGQLDRVGAVVAPFDEVSPAVSSDGRTAFATVHYSVRFDELTSADLEALREAAAPAEAAGLQVEVGGAVADFGERETEGNERFGLVVAVVVLLVALGSVIAMILPIGLGLFALLTGLGALGLLAVVANVPEDTTTLATMIGLGVGIDYALFVLTRYRQFVAQGLDRVEAIARANATAGQSVVFAGTTVIVAIAGLQLSGLPAIAMMGFGTAIVVATSVLAAITLLPAFLAIAGSRIDGLLARTRRKRATASHRAPQTTVAGRWAHHIGRHPVRYALVSLAALAVLAAPAASMRIGFSDAGVESESTTARRAYDLLAAGFGPGFNGPLLLAVDLEAANDPTSAADTVTAAVTQVPGVAAASAPTLNAAADAALITVIPAASPQAEATSELVHRLRDDVVPDLERRTGASVLVGGSTAGYEDVSELISQRLPVFIAAVVGLSVLLLVVVFRSVLVPLKAAAMNLLSIGAAYGVVVAIFQWGWARSLVGVEGTVPINPFVPMMMFAILFGLSMDYEVFLLSRIREDFQRTGDSHGSVVTGLAATARVITSAALIMIAVFGAFAANPVVLVKMIGIGLAVAVLLDATVIRLVLVPATMALLGRANWWLPAWLDRILPHVEIDAEPAGRHPAPAPDLLPPAVAAVDADADTDADERDRTSVAV